MSGHQRLRIAQEDNQTSFFDRDQDADLPPTQLSGDQNAEQSVYSSAIESNKANFILTTTTIIKTVIGSGILSLPFTVSKCGWLLSVIIFTLATVVTQFSTILLLNAKNLSGHSNYSTILYSIYRSKWSKGLGSIIIFLNNIGICIAQIIIFKQSIRKIIGDVTEYNKQVMDAFYTQEWFIVIVISFLQLPFTLVKKMEKLKFMAFLGVAGILIFMTTFIIYFFISVLDSNPDNNPIGDMKLFPSGVKEWFLAAAAVPNVLLALSYQMNFFPVFKGMRNANDKKMGQAALVGMLFCSASYLLVGILGYDLYGKRTQANFLQSILYYKTDAVIFFIINFGFLLSIFFAFPIMFFGCRNNFIALFKLFLTKDQDQKQQRWRQPGDGVEQISSYIQSDNIIEKKRKAYIYFLIYTIGIYLAIIGIGIGVDNIESVFNIIGAICSSAIGILLPCFFYFMLVSKKQKQKTYKYYLTIGIFVIMLPYAIFSVIALYVQPSQPQ